MHCYRLYSLNVRGGFTILEVMIAVCVLVVGVSAMLSTTYTLHRSRQLAEEQQQLISLGRSIVERIATADFSDLDNPAAGPWYLSRIKSASAIGGNLPPLQGAELKALAPQAALLDGARIYLEYYRGLRADADVKPAAELTGAPSLIEDFEQDLILNPATNLKRASERFREKMANPTFRASYLLTPAFNGANRLGFGDRTDLFVDDLVLVRVRIEWRERAVDLYVSKRKESAL